MSYIRVPLNNIINIKKIVTVFYFELEPTFRFDGESHDFWELIYVDRGRVIRGYGDRTCVMEKGDMFFHKPDEFHSMYCDGGEGAGVFILSFECHSTAMSYFSERKLALPDDLLPYLEQIMEEATQSFRIGVNPLIPKADAPIGSQQMLRCSLETFLIRLLRLAEREGRESDTFFTTAAELSDSLVAAVIEYLSGRIYEKVSLDELSAALHYSKSRICHIFKEKTDTSIKQYFLRAKLEEAKRLLREGDLSVTEISDKLNFESPNHFSKMFHKAVGISPSEFKRGR